jgi:GTP cyclohydrolase IIa
VTNPQLTHIQIDNYGPWTVTPEPRREMDLQTLQSRLFADMAQFVGSRDGYVFFTRADNMVAVTNGMDRRDHEVLQESVRNRYPITVSLGTAVDPVPVEALEGATAEVQNAGSAQDQHRTEVLGGEYRDLQDGDVHIAHFDVNDATGKYTDRLNEFDSFTRIEQSYASLMRYLREANGGLSFFVGGDNIISVVPEMSFAEYEAALDHVSEDAGIELKVGVGTGSTAAEAGMSAKHALEDCRYEGTRVEFDGVQE